MKVVYSYELAPLGETTIHMPEGAKVVKVYCRDGRIHLLVIHATDYAQHEFRTFTIYTTGQYIADNTKYVGTAFDELYEFHVLEVLEVTDER
jgi:hypothetical protein